MSTEITDADWVAEPQDMDYAHWSPEFQALQRMVQSSLETFHSSLTASIGELKAAVRDNMILAGPASRQPLSRSATGNSIVPQDLNNRIIAVVEQLFPEEKLPVTADPLDELQRRMVQIKSQNDQLTQKSEELRTQLVESRSKNDSILKDAKATIQKLMEERDKFRNMVVKKAGNDNQPIDYEIESAFREIRAKIQTIIHQHCTTNPSMKLIRTDGILFRHHRSLYDHQKSIFGTWTKKVPEHERYFQARAALYGILLEKIFNQEVFGLEEDLETPLASFERAIQRSKQNKFSEVADWRTSTIGCAEWIEAPHTRPELVADLISAFLQPVLPSKPGVLSKDNSRDLAEDAILQVCVQAYELALKMRKSKVEYRVESIAPNTPYTGVEDGYLKVQDFEGPSDQLMGSSISLTLFGALVKYTDLSFREWTVLEPAHVVCRTTKMPK